jgi:3-hydroxyacyl-[acyl-carrier-protein] dehydratase
MLQNDFFFIRSMDAGAGAINAVLALNPAHRIFEGHFPGQPVVPGVCMVQMIKEILETVTGAETRLIQADHLKFLTMINPLITETIRAALKYTTGENGEIAVAASLLNDNTIYFKCKALFRIS